MTDPSLPSGIATHPSSWIGRARLPHSHGLRDFVHHNCRLKNHPSGVLQSHWTAFLLTSICPETLSSLHERVPGGKKGAWCALPARVEGHQFFPSPLQFR